MTKIQNKTKFIERKNNLKYGDFGSLSKYYNKARKGYPQDVMDLLFSLIHGNNYNILDLGCGTGISTRQINETNKNVIGCDIDKKMIDVAKKFKDKIDYIIASSEKLPFKDKTFDIVTAFGAFHWFINESSVNEIKRILKSGGVFFIVNKNEADTLKEDFRKLVNFVIKQEVPQIKKNYNPKDILIENCFENINVKNFYISEFFSRSEAMNYFQSIGLWSFVPNRFKGEILQLLEKYYKNNCVNEKLERKLDIKVVWGYKK